MFLRRIARYTVVLALLSVFIVGNVLADDGRINRAPYHFGGDTLYCDQEKGCTLINMNGSYLWNWPQPDIATAFAAVDQTNVNTLVDTGDGTYGSMQLWAVSRDATTGNNTLCLIGYDEWGKQNIMCFQVTPDWVFLQAGLPVAATVLPDEGTITPPPEPVADCSMWEVNDIVKLIAGDYTTSGPITSIDAGAGTVSVDAKPGYTASCDEIEVAMT